MDKQKDGLLQHSSCTGYSVRLLFNLLLGTAFPICLPTSMSTDQRARYFHC